MDSQPHYSVLILVSETTHAIPLDFPSWPSSTSTNATSPTVDRNRNDIRLQIHFNINIFNSHVHPDKISYFILLILSSSLHLLCNCEQQKAAVKWFTTKTSTAQHRGPTNLYSLKMNSLLVQQVTAYIIIQHNSLFHNRLFVTSLVSRIIAQVLRAARWLKLQPLLVTGANSYGYAPPQREPSVLLLTSPTNVRYSFTREQVNKDNIITHQICFILNIPPEKKQKRKANAQTTFKCKTGNKIKYFLKHTSVTQNILCIIFLMYATTIQHLNYSGQESKKAICSLWMTHLWPWNTVKVWI